MKSTFKLGSIEIQGVKLNNIEFTQEYTAQDAINLTFAGKSFVRGLIKELPEILEDLEVAFNKFNEIDKRVEDKESREAENKMPAEIKEFFNHIGIKVMKGEF